MTAAFKSAVLLTATALLSACATAPDPLPPVDIEVPQVVKTCAPVSALQRVEIPAETKIQYAITMIDNPPYEPIESKVKQTRVVKPAEVIYINSEGRQILDICENVQVGPVGPGAGELIQY